MMWVIYWITLSLTAASPSIKKTAIGAARKYDAGLKRVIGKVEKFEENPLLEQTEVWEPRFDNGYPNVIQADDVWHLYYGDCVAADGSCAAQIVLYAWSKDGLKNWSKPNLGVFNLDTLRPDLQVGTKNNIVLQGGGVGITKHGDEYIAFGNFCAPSTSKAHQKMLFGVRKQKVISASLPSCPEGYESTNVAISNDGFNFNLSKKSYDWPDPQAYDCHNNMYYDNGRWLATTRLRTGDENDRSIGIATAQHPLSFDDSVLPNLTLTAPSHTLQAYSQITFKWWDIWLGLVMLYEDESSSSFGYGKVYCRLAFALEDRPLANWTFVQDDSDFIPLGHQGSSTQDPTNDFDSHICFAAAVPITYQGSERIYYMGGNGPHNGDRNSSLGLATLGKDRFAAVAGSGTYETTDIEVVATTLKITLDILNTGGYVKLISINANDTVDIDPIKINATDHAFPNLDLSPYLDQNVTFVFELHNAALYTISLDDNH